MQSVKFLKPYYVKKDDRFVRVILAYQYFSIIMDEKVYHFIPLESREIVLDRFNREIVNKHDQFVFQKGATYVKFPLIELMGFDSFEEQLGDITDEHFDEKQRISHVEVDLVISELVHQNVDRLIDQALLEGDKEKFSMLTSQYYSR
ncbi:IDEAL domain-containing protein [Alkalibacillus aidingensis]|uniref:IDEAL domain-containing protein n=1 Tax=Alkalibacillus aidingensis TaxID=2747607 RepID=UPI00166085F5|nr:IDEAL domain-containing protein [Alkalibacillus aidingensis]